MATQDTAVKTLLDPEAFRTIPPAKDGKDGQAPSIVPHTPGSPDDFALLRAHIARLEHSVQNQQGARRGDSDGAAVTAAVTAPQKGATKGRRRNRKEIFVTPTPTTGANVPTFDSLMAVATQLGEEAGKGKDTQIKFDMKVLEGAYLGALSMEPNKHGTGRRDGMLLAEAYVKAQQTSVIFDAKADKSRKLISNVDKMIKLGGNPKWGVGQPLQNVNELVTFRQSKRKDPTQAKKLDDAHNMLMRYATAQLKSDQLIDGDARDAFAFKKEINERSVEDVLETIRKTANNLKAGRIAHCPALDNSPEVQAIINACTKRLTAIAKARGGGQNTGTP